MSQTTRATCVHCGLSMQDGITCIVDAYEYADGTAYDRIPYGCEKGWQEAGLAPNEYCGDCAAPLGGLHHANCDMEECPRCGRQSIGCGCA